MKIARFLTVSDAKRVLAEYSTFALVSSLYYRQLGWENDGVIGDRNENYVQFQESRRIYESGAATLLSCWTALSGDELPLNDWNIFPDRRNGVAVVSTVESVDRLLRKLVAKILGLADEVKWGWHFTHGKVRYYDGGLHPPEFDTMDGWQWKLDRYENQREYRFAFLAESTRMHLQTVIFQMDDPETYVEKIYFGPSVSEDDKRKLVAGAIAANLVSKIQNFDELYGR